MIESVKNVYKTADVHTKNRLIAEIFFIAETRVSPPESHVLCKKHSVIYKKDHGIRYHSLPNQFRFTEEIIFLFPILTSLWKKQKRSFVDWDDFLTGKKDSIEEYGIPREIETLTCTKKDFNPVGLEKKIVDQNTSFYQLQEYLMNKKTHQKHYTINENTNIELGKDTLGFKTNSEGIILFDDETSTLQQFFSFWQTRRKRYESVE